MFVRYWRDVLLCLVLLTPPELSAVWYAERQHDPLYVQSGVGTILLGWALLYLLAASLFHMYETRQDNERASRGTEG